MSIETPDPNQPTLDPNLTRSYHAPEPGERAIQTEAPTIPGYAIISLLGRGGMGEVYKATHLGLHRTVALKIIRKDLVNSKGALLRFQREMRAAGNLDHPNVIAAQDAGETGGVFYFAMDYCEGIDLKQYVEQKGPLPVDEACDLIRQAALGLQHIHEHGLVHRDIKPSNLLLASSSLSPASGERAGVRGSSSESGGALKILDLGLARLRASEDTGQSITDTGIMMGTPDYTAPEQITNAHGVDIRADLYSLGCTFYFLLTGQAPFKGGTVLEKLRRHQVEDAPAVQELRKDVPKIVAAIIGKLIAKKPEERVQTPGELAVLLEVARDNPNHSNSLEGFQSPQTLSRKLSRRSLLVAGSATIAAAVGIPLWISSRKERSPNKEQGLEAHQPPEIIGEIRRFDFGKESIRSVAWSPDGTRIAACGGDFLGPKEWKLRGRGRNYSVHVWDVATAEKTHILKSGAMQLSSVSFTQHSKHVFAVCDDGMIREWNLESDDKPIVYFGNDKELSCFDLAPDETAFITGGRDNTLRWWNRESRLEYRLPSVHPSALEGVAYLPQIGLVVSSVQPSGLFLWRVDDATEVRRIPDWLFTQNVGSLSRGGRTLLPCFQNNAACLLDVADGTVETRFLGHKNRIYSIALSPNGKRLLTGDYGGSIFLWDAEGAEHIITFDGHKSVVTRVQFSPDGKQAISGALDGSMILWGLPA